MDRAIVEELEYAKRKGLNAVQQFVSSYSHTKKYKWELLPISKKTADKLIRGEFKTMNELLSYDSMIESFNTDIILLYRIISDKNRNTPVEVVETLFINE